ncbi:MAG: hypothetical protein JO166_13185 [Deltaproteobacteria bacterium]|nr:hypothetical protein [Deltaproteobacteria bacterium]
MSTLTEALAAVDDNGERLCEPELYRMKGQLTLQSGRVYKNSKYPVPPHIQRPSQLEIEAEGYFRRAIAIALRQSAKPWQLRATTSLAQLLAGQGRRDEARAMLAEIYNWFTEGFDTADPKQAKTLLDELTG